MEEPISDVQRRLSAALGLRNMRPVDLARATNISKASISQYLSGRVKPASDRLHLIASALHVSEVWLLGYDVPMEEAPVPYPATAPSVKMVPLLGNIACGEPILAEDNILDYVAMPDEFDGTFALRCKGDSMINARIFDGDIVYIRQQPEVENGEIAAVLIDGEATLKRFYRTADRITLRPENPLYRDLVYTAEEMHEIHVIGKAIAFASPIQ